MTELLAQLVPPAFRPLLVDADPAGGDWLLRPGVAPEPGLSSLAMVGRRGLRAEELSEHVQHLGPRLRVLVAPAAARQATAALQLVAEQLSAALSGLDAVIDCGSLFDGSPAMPLLKASDLVVLVGRPTADAMVHLAPWVEELRDEGTSVAVVLSTAGVPARAATYRPGEVAEALGVDCLLYTSPSPRDS